MYDNFFVLDHPLIQHKITMLRDIHTGTSQFRALIQEIATLMGYEVLRDPALLQRMFFREMRACRVEPTANSNIVRWGVPAGTRDPETGKFIHDDLVMSAALCVFSQEDLPIVTQLPPDLPWTDHPITGARRETYAERMARFR